MNEGSRWHHPFFRFVQHLVFWVLSYIVFVQLFKTSVRAEKIDYIYAALFHITLLPAVYLNLGWVLPRLATYRRWPFFLVAIAAVIVLFGTVNYLFFQDWSTFLLPDYYFISYFSWWEVGLFFLIYLMITSLLKLSRSWFMVNELQKKLLETEKEKMQIELKALRSQLDPHFFFNLLNGIYSMSLDKDERLPNTILQLSELMGYMLYESKEELVPLYKEWKVVHDYIALQSVRFGSRVHIEKKLQGEFVQQKIAPLLLTTFLENAFKHGAGLSSHSNMRILLRVEARDIYFTLENTKEKVTEEGLQDYKGVGLQNVQRRLALLYPGKHQLTISDTGSMYIINLHLQL